MARPRSTTGLFLLPAFFAGAGRAEAQGYLLLQVDGTAALDRAGSALAFAGDLDGDGVGDLLIGVPVANPAGAVDAGSVLAISGATGATLYAVFAGVPGENFGFAVASVADLDADGVRDVLVGAPFPSGLGSGAARLYSGATGAPLLPLPSPGGATDFVGFAVAGIGDMDGDGAGDLLVGAPAVGGAVGEARVHSGATGLLLWSYAGSVSGDFFGYAAAAGGDSDGDGVPDFIVGSQQISCVGPPPVACDSLAGFAIVFSGASGAPIYTFTGSSNDEQLGTAVADAGDTDGDGVPDWIAGGRHPFAGAGEAKVFSGATGVLLLALTSTSSLNWFGAAVAGAGDADGDGLADLLVGAPGEDPDGLGPILPGGRVWLRSGANGVALASFTASAGYERFGEAVAGGGDLDGDGVADFAIGVPLANPSGILDAGRTLVVSFVGVPAGSTLLGTGCPGTAGIAPRISSSGGAPSSAGTPGFAIHLSRALGGAPALLLAGSSAGAWSGVPLPLNLAFLGLPACDLRVAPDLTVVVAANGSGPGGGHGSASVPVPNDPALAGGTAYFQWCVFDPGSGGPIPIALTPALAVVVL